MNGSISPTGNVSVREGRDQTFTITPDKGYVVANVKIDGRSIGAVKSYTFENVKRAHTIEVSFTRANEFIDVPAGSYYYDAVLWAVEKRHYHRRKREPLRSERHLHQSAGRGVPVARSRQPRSQVRSHALCRCEGWQLLL